MNLAEARQKAAEARRLRHEGVDPIEARKAVRTASLLAQAQGRTFDDCAAGYIEAHRAGWRNAKHAAQWKSTLDTYASPVLGKLPVQSVDTGLVLKVLEPIWKAKPETANRLRGRIEAVLDWATVRTYRTGENPARWRGHLDHLLPARNKVQRPEHHAALPYSEIGDFMAALRQQAGTAARALELLILTAARTSEVIGARWSEIDTNRQLWTVPATRIKGAKEHRVPLSAAAIALLRAIKADAEKLPPSDFVFNGARWGKPLSNMAMLKLLARMKRNDLTAHGFRSTFRDWVAERTSYPREAAEMALAHVVSDKVEAAYRRGDLFEKRRRMMDEWARFSSIPSHAGKRTGSENVISLAG
jgi:integrase